MVGARQLVRASGWVAAVAHGKIGHPTPVLAHQLASAYENWSNQLDPGSALDLNDITDGHLSPLAELNLTIDADASLGDEDFRLTAAQDAARQFENLGQVDRTVADFEAHALDVAHF